MAAIAPRHLALAVVALVHVALAAVVFGGGVVVRPDAASAIETFDVAAAAPPVAPVPPIVLEAVTADIAAPEFAVQVEVAAAPAPAMGGCRIGETIQAALAADAEVRAALAAVPAAARSVANAVLVWDRRWADALGGPAASNPIRRAIVAQIEGATPACRDAPNVGPRLFIVAADAAPTALALGSGTWKWAELLS